MSTRLAVVLMTAVLALYVVLVVQRAVLLVLSGDAVGITMGIVLIVLPVLAAWTIGREIWFGVRAQRLGRRLADDPALTEAALALRPSGRAVRADAEALFPRFREAVEASPDDWAAWYRLGLAYDAAGDRRRAREAIRRAIRLESGR